MKTIFSITGYTAAEKYVFSSWFSDANDAYKQFISKYPRFKGHARLATTKAKDEGDILIAYGPWVTINTFESTKQAKTLVGV